MRFKLTLVLLLANLAVFFLLWRLNQPPEIVARPAGPIPTENFDIDHLIIDDNVPADTRELKRDSNNVWHLVRPVDWLADKYAVQDLTSQLEFLDVKTTFSIDDLQKSGETLKTYGLDNPAIKISVFSGARAAELDIGHAVGGSYLYVRNPKDGLVRVVAQDLLSNLDMSLDDLRDKRLFTIMPYAVQRLSITVAGTGSTPAFTRFVLNNDQWRLDTPFSCPADSGQVTGVLGQLANLHADSFVPAANTGDLARFGLNAPLLKIELKGDANEPSQELWLGGTVPGTTEKEYYAKLADNPTVVVVKDNKVFTILMHAQDALRERQFLTFSPEQVSTIVVNSADGSQVQMEMLEDGKWQIVDKDGTAPAPNIAADAGIIKTLLGSLHDLSAKSFPSDAPTSDDLQNTFNLKNPAWKVALQGDKTFKPITLDVGISTVSTPVRYYAKIEGADSVYEIDSDIISQLSTSPLHFRDRTLEKLPDGAQVVSVKLTELTGDDLKSGDTVLDYALPAKITWDEFLKDKPEMIRDNLPVVLDAIKQFTVDTYREGKFDEQYQMDLAQSSSTASEWTPAPWRYRLDAGVQLPVAGGAAATMETLTFYFSDKLTPTTRLGGTRDAPLPAAVFTLPLIFRGALGSILVGQDQPAAAVQTVHELDQPINPATAVPAASSSATTATPSVPTIAPLDMAIPAPAPVPTAPSATPAP